MEKLVQQYVLVMQCPQIRLVEELAVAHLSLEGFAQNMCIKSGSEIYLQTTWTNPTSASFALGWIPHQVVLISCLNCPLLLLHSCPQH